MLSYVFLTVLDPAARFISITLHVDKSLKMAAKMAAKLAENSVISRSYIVFVKVGPQSFFAVVTFSMDPTS